MYEQELLIDSFRTKYWGTPLSPGVLAAFLAMPRHRFVKKFSPDGERWITLTEQNVENYLPLLYADTTLLLYEDGTHTCTISQPSLVLKMLELLEIRPGHKVFELGAGSGWNAAMMGHMVGPEGKVISVEIIEEMATQAALNIQSFDMPQVSIIHADGSKGYFEEAPFDRGVFTAGAYDIPAVFYDQIKDGGKLLFVLKTPGLGDLLLSLRKVQGHFVEEDRVHVIFVPVTGTNVPEGRDEINELVTKSRLTIYPKKNVIIGSESVFVF
ncbi:MAG TPA: protein-L-isoaspartate O-methyltransferase [Bacteriovoracaceae bacterium]|nr:protein-L-isoaspartate O-methyltransferase [Bacteriovoracaceae bacterium]